MPTKVVLGKSIFIKPIFHFKWQRCNYVILVLTLALYLLASCKIVYAQSAKSFYKTGIEYLKTNQLNPATAAFTSALNLNPTYSDALEERGKCFIKLQEFDKALIDYNILHQLYPKNTNYIYTSGCMFMNLKKWKEAQQRFLILESDEINLHVGEVNEKLIVCALMMKDFEGALNRAGQGINDFPNDEIYRFYYGNAYDSLNDPQAAAISYEKAISMVLNKTKKEKKSSSTSTNQIIKYYTSLGDAHMHLYDFDRAISNYSSAIDINNKNDTLFYKRGIAFYSKYKFNESLNEYNQAIALGNKSMNLLISKAQVYKKLGLFNQAIEILSKISANDTAYYNTILLAQCYESIGHYKDAKSTFEKANKMSLIKNTKEAQNGIIRNKNKLYDSQRERDAPEIIIYSPAIILNDNLLVTTSQTFIEIKGKIKDNSAVKSIIINDVLANFETDSLNPDFSIKLNIKDKQEVLVLVSDIYSNKTEQIYKLDRREINKPSIRLHNSTTLAGFQIYYNPKKGKTLHISGIIEDESLIKKFFINDVSISYNLNALNPTFEATIDPSKTDSVIFKITDGFDNESRISYFINKKELEQIEANPMGKTWLIFIENSNYEFLNSLEGTQKDVNTLRGAVLGYKFDNILVRKNMTYTEMDKFFRIDLRDEIKINQVKSIIVWYAGHGRFLNETGYWVPVDAKKDDEGSFFPLSNLKGNLSAYGQSLKHILIVSDACEAGPSFNTTELNETILNCNSTANLQKGSAQFFSSTTNEKASDNSLFCESFANILNNNNNPCIDVSQIIKGVSLVVEKNQNQRCKSGKIQGFENNEGSFLFMKK